MLQHPEYSKPHTEQLADPDAFPPVLGVSTKERNRQGIECGTGNTL